MISFFKCGNLFTIVVQCEIDFFAESLQTQALATSYKKPTPACLRVKKQAKLIVDA